MYRALRNTPRFEQPKHRHTLLSHHNIHVHKHKTPFKFTQPPTTCALALQGNSIIQKNLRQRLLGSRAGKKTRLVFGLKRTIQKLLPALKRLLRSSPTKTKKNAEGKIRTQPSTTVFTRITATTTVLTPALVPNKRCNQQHE